MLKYLTLALSKDQKFGATNVAHGMFYIRQKNYEKAIEYLKKAHFCERENDYYAYIYAVTLNSVYGLNKVIAFIESNLASYKDSFLFTQLSLA